jgi:homoserine acetyltransferase
LPSLPPYAASARACRGVRRSGNARTRRNRSGHCIVGVVGIVRIVGLLFWRSCASLSERRMTPIRTRRTSVSETVHGSFTFSNFRLQRGNVLPEVTIAYATRGELAPDGRNAVLVTHGYTSGQRMIEAGAGSSEGAWSTLIGPGAPIDTDRCFVVCSNMLGSSYGSTNAASRDPCTGRPYGSRFPHITLTDIVTAQHRLLGHLGVRHLRAVAGPSYGGFQAFQWAVTSPIPSFRGPNR